MRSNAKRLDELMEELDEIKTLSSHLEDFVFLEEAATKLVTEIRKLSQKYPRDQNLEEAARETARGFEQFHHGVIDVLSRALEAFDEAEETRQDEAEELKG